MAKCLGPGLRDVITTRRWRRLGLQASKLWRHDSTLILKLLSHIDALADAQGTNTVVRHTAKYVGCKFISRSLIGTIRLCAFMCIKGRKKFWTCSKIIFATNAQAYSFIVRWLYGPYVA